MTAPTLRPVADVIEDQLIRVDQLAHRLFGPRETEWTDAQWADYEAAARSARVGEAA